MLDFVKIADSTRECQRNWNNEKVKDEDIETIVQSAINMPSRKQMIDFELFVVTNPETIKQLFRISVDDRDFSLNPRAKYHNGQMMAPLILIWGETKNEKVFLPSAQTEGYVWGTDQREVAYRSPEKPGVSPVTKNLHIGISAGCAGIVSRSLGYQTGYCGCVLEDEMLKFLNNYSSNVVRFSLALGIGRGREGIPRNHVFDPDDPEDHVWIQALYGPKSTPVYRI